MTNNNRIVAGFDKKYKKKSHRCMHNECTSNAINSHYLQSKGILSSIADNGHLFTIRVSDGNSWGSAGFNVEEKLVGINNIMSSDLFCNKHDDELFKPIEKNTNTDYSSYFTFILLTYRITCAEIRTKEYVIALYEHLDENTIGFQKRQQLWGFLNGTKKSFEKLNNLKVCLVNELSNLNEPKAFTFKYYELPLIPICASAIFTNMSKDEIKLTEDKNIDPIHIIHIFTHDNKLKILVGYHNESSLPNIIDFMNSWENLDHTKLGEQLTNLISTKIEMWCCSPNYYKKISKETKKKFTSYVRDNILNFDKNQVVSFNLFLEKN